MTTKQKGLTTIDLQALDAVSGGDYVSAVDRCFQERADRRQGFSTLAGREACREARMNPNPPPPPPPVYVVPPPVFPRWHPHPPHHHHPRW